MVKKKKLSDLLSCNKPVNAGTRTIGAKTARPGVDYRPH